MKLTSFLKVVLLLAVLFGASTSLFAQTILFNYTGTVQWYSVPAGITALSVDMQGAKGGNGLGGNGGGGGRVQCTLSVTPGTVIYFYVGGQGINYNGATVTAGGYNGGGSGYAYGGGGGGASDMRTGGTALTNRLISAAGGGGGSYNCTSEAGGCGGGLTGTDGIDCGTYTSGTCGAGGTQTSGGIAGSGGTAGTTAVGGSAGTSGTGAGGGGGYYGGGSGNTGSGGGGSSYTDATLCSSVTLTACYNTTGNGSISITNIAATPITGSVPTCVGSTITLSNATTGGTWSSSNTSVATIGSSSGIVTGVSAGTARITYTTTSTYVTTTVTINATPATIGGITNVCAGTTTMLTNATTGGKWSNACTTIVTVGSATGIVSAVTAGTCIVSYSLATGCSATATVTVVTAPSAITGPTALCAGNTVTLSSAVISGCSWGSSNTAVATVGTSSGVVAGVAAGVATISYSNGSGCFATVTVTVAPAPAAISGPGALCVGSSVTLSTSTGGGTWSSSNTSVATVGSSSGIVSGLTAGTTMISYITGSGCYALFIDTIVAAPAAIAGPSGTCVGYATLYTNATSGGIWTSSNSAVATIGSGSGILSGLTAGTTTISYATGAGCFATTTVTVSAAPATISGPGALCSGTTITLSTSTGGGTWSSSNTSVATVGSSSGIVSGITAGTTIISYSTGSGCSAVFIDTVVATPSAITGPPIVCLGYAALYSNVTTGGVWSSGNTSIVVIGTGSGVVTGLTTGTVTITYTVSGLCSATRTVTVTSLPPAITGPSFVCTGSLLTLSNTATPGVWSSSMSAIAFIGSTTGIVTGMSPGTSLITFTTSSTGCFVTKMVTVVPLPSAISGLTTICQYSNTTLLSSSGGLWSSSNTSVAIVGSLSGDVYGVAAGTATITCSLGTGCYVTTTMHILLSPAPITGITGICDGTSSALSNTVAGGVWASSDPTVAIVGTTGTMVGVGRGTCRITYSLSSGCRAMVNATVYPIPGTISGTSYVCMGQTTTLSNPSSGGTWSSSNTNAIIGSSSGIVTGISVGTAVITYKLPTTCFITTVVSVQPNPSAITGAGSVCAGVTTCLTSATLGGTWTSSSLPVASVGSMTGCVTGVSAGTTTITYKTSAGCTATKTFTVLPSPASITGGLNVCTGSATGLSTISTGGTWSSSNSSVATVGSSTGITTGISSGTSVISYTLPTGCGVLATLSVSPLPSAISGTTSLCTGGTTSLTNTTLGGTWSSSNTTIATVNSSGTATGVSSGTATITYKIFTTGCLATTVVTVNPSATISGISVLCSGTTTTLSGSISGGTWTSSNTSVATVGSTSGIVSGVSGGTCVISYLLGTGCLSTFIVTINATPATIAGTASTCVGNTTTLTNATSGGTWSSSNTAIASISSTGIVTGIASGTATITYQITGTGCFTTAVVTISPAVSIIGASSFCEGTTITLSSSVPGGTWTSSNTAIATIGSSSGVVSGVAGGTAVISYQLSSGCSATFTDTVLAAPAAISGTASACVSGSTTLTDATSGGTWSSSNTTIATIGSSTGIVNGIAAGTATITYTLSTGCSATAVATIDPLPSISVSSTATCGNTDTLTATGAVTYSWSPSAGLACSTCAATGVSPAATTIYTVTGTSTAGCVGDNTITVNGDRIFGHITFSGYIPDTLDMKVWLIQYNPSDSSIVALDSTTTCVIDSVTYYEFNSKPSGNYMVKAKMVYGSPAGGSGYIPTYSLSTPNWNTAATISHAGASDSLHITMILGTVPPGPGFIGGYVYSGAGKGTAGETPYPGMPVYLLDAATHKVLTCTYTDGTGAYAFSGIAYGDYIIHPEEYQFNTTPSSVVSITPTTATVTNVNFKRHISPMYTITPFDLPVATNQLTATSALAIYPNPSAGTINIEWQNQTTENATVVITDVTGREVYKSVLNIRSATGSRQTDISDLLNGVYLVTIRSEHIYYSGKLQVLK